MNLCGALSSTCNTTRISVVGKHKGIATANNNKNVIKMQIIKVLH